ncbi:phenylalanine--tRNA ligase subunit beta [Thermophagus sp. OGC60D27]|uniref:phenylalanine--tRNA ligase subunit beta n=1 Tax=Thermophagus sp. OGC60D27 TaxID=3458415 RepID=UPI004038401C
MNISYNWLKNYISTELPADQIAAILTDLGLEVGSVEEVDSVKGGLKGLVIGEVLTCEKHPNADKLSKTTVDVGEGEPLPIVCGAPNVAAGQKVVVAKVGTTIYPLSGEEFEIKKAKIRGEVSQGMICAEDEIGLGPNHDGIMVLDADAIPGTPAAQYFNIETDIIFEVDLTPNRIDGASHIGVARDLAAKLKQTDPAVEVKWPSVEDFGIDNRAWPVSVEVADNEGCIRYSGLTISNLEVKESPDWLKNRLRAIGQTPINNVVDVTNFILHELGQPLHAFDGDKIKGNRVIVRRLAGGTKFTTLDENERELHEQDLMICNAEEGMCIAGVFGGLESGVTDSTRKIFLESACFNPVYIRKTAKRHGLNTDASFRFERGTDPNMTVYALKRAAMLIKEVAGGTISSDIVDVYPEPVQPFSVELSLNHVQRLIGKKIESDQIRNILQALDIEMKSEENGVWKLEVPPYRVDVQREADVIEEILRVYGYNNVADPDKLNATIIYREKPDIGELRNKVSSQLVAQGFMEIMNNSLTKGGYYDQSETYARNRVVELINPLSSDLNGLRQTLLFGGLETIRHNRNRQNPNLRLFEFGNCYSLKEDKLSTDLGSYREEEKLALLATGNLSEGDWNTPDRKVSFFDLKSWSLNILERMGIDTSQCKETDCNNDLISEGLQVTTVDGQALFIIGMVDSKLLKQFDIDDAVYFAEMNWPALVKLSARQEVTFTEISRFPEVKRDLALLLDKPIMFKDIRNLAFKTEKKYLKNVSLFDVYEGQKLGPGKKSYAISFTLQDREKTLKDKQIDKTMNNLTRIFEKELGAKLR